MIKKIKEHIADKKVEENFIYNKWFDFGFLDGISEEIVRRNLASLFEELCKAILNLEFKSSRTETVFIPIASYCFKYLNYKIQNVYSFLNYIDRRLSQDENLLREEALLYRAGIDNKKIDDIDLERFDWEAEFCVVLANEVKAMKL